MSIEFEIVGSLVRVRADAAGTEEGIRDGIERATRHPDFQPRSAVLVDVRSIQEAPASRTLAATGQLLGREGARHFSRAAFVASGPLQFGLTRIFGSHADASGLEVQVFEREEDALRWLVGA
jgi:hypothetical protein